MALAMKATVTTMSSNPCWRSRLTTCSIIGMLAIGNIGLGWFEVSGRSRVPSPPAMITAFIQSPLLRTGPLAVGQRLAGHRDVGSRPQSTPG